MDMISITGQYALLTLFFVVQIAYSLSLGGHPAHFILQ